ncbi:uncharacterized protein LOC110039037 [Phalaenopsis equestris]|uniref:uncharacterized protein LOC110039037 n=1 Tax=Phalaenopsis equestris TaxID=78828 RepID=UPI0009E46F42|nr:uncharacterized protein LOC110039037 [Phalaenopsis equestris]
MLLMLGMLWFQLWKLHKKVASAFRAWNWEVFGDVHARVVKAESMVQHLQAIDESSNDVVSQLKDANNELLAASIQEEELLQQKVGEVHFVQGDRNMKYFYAWIKQRHANNTIIRIKYDCGNWITSNRDLGVSAVQYFQNLFLPSQNVGTIDSSLFNDVRDYTENLVLRGIPTANDIFQVICKILVKRLQPHLNQIISHNQSAFIQGRGIIDNIMLALELLLDIDRKFHGSNMITKLDICKAYDSLNWEFILDILKARGFSTSFRYVSISSVLFAGFSFLGTGTDLDDGFWPNGLVIIHRDC